MPLEAKGGFSDDFNIMGPYYNWEIGRYWAPFIELKLKAHPDFHKLLDWTDLKFKLKILELI